jgi:hypothetical protein
VLASHRDGEQGAGLLLVTAAFGTHKVVTHEAPRLGLSKPFAWTALGVGALAALYWTQSNPARRGRIGKVLDQLMAAIADAYSRAAAAEDALVNSHLLTQQDPNRLEVRVASYLVRHPDTNMGELAAELELDVDGRRELSALLKEHPSFELASRYGWSVGRTREHLETEPSKDWRPTRTP